MSRLDKQDWLRGAFALLAEGGQSAVKIEPLAKRLGVTKGSFYWHFDDRPALLRALLDHWVEVDTERVIELVEAPTTATGTRADATTASVDEDDPIATVHRLLELSLTASGEADDAEVAIRAWANADPDAAAVTAKVDERRISYVRELFVAAGVRPDVAEGRAHLLYRVLIGESTWRRHGGAPIDTRTVHELIDRLAEP